MNLSLYLFFFHCVQTFLFLSLRANVPFSFTAWKHSFSFLYYLNNPLPMETTISNIERMFAPSSNLNFFKKMFVSIE